MKLMFVITAVAAIALGVFLVSMVPHFNVANLLDIPVTEAKGAGSASLLGRLRRRVGRDPLCHLVSWRWKVCRWPLKNQELSATCRVG